MFKGKHKGKCKGKHKGKCKGKHKEGTLWCKWAFDPNQNP